MGRKRGSSSAVPEVIRVDARADDPVEQLIARSRRHRAKGDTRRAIVLLREACMLDDNRARTYTLLGALLTRIRHVDDAARALRHARWLRERAGERGRANATKRLIERLELVAA